MGNREALIDVPWSLAESKAKSSNDAAIVKTNTKPYISINFKSYPYCSMLNKINLIDFI